jgi:hypothetical protein
MHFIRSTIFIIALSCTIGISQGKPNNSSLNNFKDYVKDLLNIMGVENEYTRFLSYMKVYPPEDMKMRALYNEFFSFDAYTSDLTQIYAKYYTLDDVINLIKFYSSLLGKKTLQLNHELHKKMEDIMLNKISDYILTSTEQGFDILLPEISK